MSNYSKIIIVNLLFILFFVALVFGTTALFIGWIYCNIPLLLSTVSLVIAVLSFVGGKYLQKNIIKSAKK